MSLLNEEIINYKLYINYNAYKNLKYIPVIINSISIAASNMFLTTYLYRQRIISITALYSFINFVNK